MITLLLVVQVHLEGFWVERCRITTQRLLQRGPKLEEALEQLRSAAQGDVRITHRNVVALLSLLLYAQHTLDIHLCDSYGLLRSYSALAVRAFHQGWDTKLSLFLHLRLERDFCSIWFFESHHHPLLPTSKKLYFSFFCHRELRQKSIFSFYTSGGRKVFVMPVS